MRHRPHPFPADQRPDHPVHPLLRPYDTRRRRLHRVVMEYIHAEHRWTWILRGELGRTFVRHNDAAKSGETVKRGRETPGRSPNVVSSTDTRALTVQSTRLPDHILPQPFFFRPISSEHAQLADHSITLARNHAPELDV